MSVYVLPDDKLHRLPAALMYGSCMKDVCKDNITCFTSFKMQLVRFIWMIMGGFSV